jgi:hypothetical protein
MQITGTFLHVDDTPRVGVWVEFIPEDVPAPDGLGVLTAPTVSVVTDDDGAIPPTILEQGNYLVRVGLHKRDYFRIFVPDSTDTADITSLMTTVTVVIDDMIQTGDNFRVRNGIFQLRNRDTGLWHRLDMVGAAGVEQIEWGPGVTAGMPQTGSNFRISSGEFQLKNRDTGLFHTLVMVGLEGVEQIEWTSPGIA